MVLARSTLTVLPSPLWSSTSSSASASAEADGLVPALELPEGLGLAEALPPELGLGVAVTIGDNGVSEPAPSGSPTSLAPHATSSSAVAAVPTRRGTRDVRVVMGSM